MRSLLIAYLFLITCTISYAQRSNYSKIAFKEVNASLLQTLQANDLVIDHYLVNEDGNLEAYFSEKELLVIEGLGLEFEVLIPDVKAHFEQLLSKDKRLRDVSCGLQHFDDGDMGGYHTYANVVDHVHRMAEEYPQWARLMEIGASYEERPIYAIRMGNTDKQDNEMKGCVYFDAAHHSREPMSVESILYFMWWVLENADSSTSINYLLNNRVMYFVPMVNPDGYVFNETNDPNGGGMWRKNRRPIDDCFGVDLNRNYSYGWGLNPGSSDNPCSDLYRGPEPFSEPETQATRALMEQAQPSIAFSMHTFGDKFLSPYGYTDTLADYKIYAEFTSEFIPETYAGYGNTPNMLGYTSSGTTRDYLHSEGIYGWTPEIGHSFWESPDVICDRVKEFKQTMLYITWVSGEYPSLINHQVIDEGVLEVGDQFEIDLLIKNRGLGSAVQQCKVKLIPLNEVVTLKDSIIAFGTINAGDKTSSNQAFELELIDSLPAGELIGFVCEIYLGQGEVLASKDTFYVQAGNRSVYFLDDFESGMNLWRSTGKEAWDTTTFDAYSGQACLTDSPGNNYDSRAATEVALDTVFDLSETTLPVLSFNTKYSLQYNLDKVILWLVEAETGERIKLQEFTGNKHWHAIFVDLTAYRELGTVSFVFEMDAGSRTHSDGIYIDDFSLIDCFDTSVLTQVGATTANEAFDIYPNPAGDLIQVHGHKSTNLKAYEVYNRQGVKMESAKLPNLQDEKLSIETKDWQPGLYIIRFYFTDHVSHKHVVVR